jgi:hypothetical protein
MHSGQYEYDAEGDVLDVYFSDKQPAWTIELTPNIMISIDRSAKRAVQLTLMDYSELVRMTEEGPRSFPITGLATMPFDERRLVLEILTSSPISEWLDISTVQMLPDSPFTVTHLEPPPPALRDLVTVFA